MIRSNLAYLGHVSSFATIAAGAAILATDIPSGGLNALPIKGDAAMKNTTIVGGGFKQLGTKNKMGADGFKCTATDGDLVDERLSGTKTARAAGFTATDPSAVLPCSPFCHCAGLANQDPTLQ